MQLSKLTPDKIKAYFAARLPNLPTDAQGEVTLPCPFHDDARPSFGVDLERGFWKCHTGCGGGMILDFEKRFSGTDDAAALEAIFTLTGDAPLPFYGTHVPDKVFPYVDEFGKPLFDVVRRLLPNGKKTFVQRHKVDGKTVMGIKGIRRVLYRLPEVITARDVFIVEGEKCVEALASALTKYFEANPLKKNAHPPVVTCNPGGAGKWDEDYSPYFAGKQVVILPDNDEVGAKHAQHVAGAVFPFAAGVKVVNLPNLGDGGDVADYLDRNGVPELFQQIRQTVRWKPPQADSGMFLPASRFIKLIPDQTDWLVENVIELAANGFFAADPKGGKSWAVVDLCLALATGMPWLGFNIPKRVKVALVSREDNAGRTGIRMKALMRGRGIHDEELDGYLYVNSRMQSKSLMLDNPTELQELIDNLKLLGAQIVFLDVFNVMHGAEENDNTEMRKVLNHVTRIQNEVGCSVFLVHHFNKGNPDQMMTQRLRGAGANAGFAEVVIGIGYADRAIKIRKMEFELKAGESPAPVYYQIVTTEENRVSKLERMPDSYQEPLKGESSWTRQQQ